MQRPDDKKRRLIVECAGRLFAARPFHKVTLEDIAAEAGVGKGTLYVYFTSKEDLFSSVVREGFGQIVDQFHCRLAGPGLSPVDGLRQVVTDLFHHAFSHPEYFELMRTTPGLVYKHDPCCREKFHELTRLIAGMITAGVEAGVFSDPHPELTAVFIPGLVRSLMMFGPSDMDERTTVDHVTDFIIRGLGAADPRLPS